MSVTKQSTPDQAPIPIVDFSRFLHGTPTERKDVAAQLDAAFRTAGFVHLINHGVPQEQVDECFAWVRPPPRPLPQPKRFTLR